MLGKILKTIIGGGIGLGALYCVGKLAYTAGREMGHEEARYEQMRSTVCMKSAEEPKELQKVPEKQGLLNRSFAKKPSILGGLLKHPERHKVEAQIENDTIQIQVKRKEVTA